MDKRACGVCGGCLCVVVERTYGRDSVRLAAGKGRRCVGTSAVGGWDAELKKKMDRVFVIQVASLSLTTCVSLRVSLRCWHRGWHSLLVDVSTS